jgi:hypothetical protein
MGQVESVSQNSNNYYTVITKPFKGDTSGHKIPQSNNSIRYTVPNKIIQKLTSIDITDKENNMKNLKTRMLLMFFVTNFCENIPQLCDTYDSSKPSYVYINLGENKDNKVTDELKSIIYYLENDLEAPVPPLKLIDPPSNYLYNISPCLPNTTCGNVDLGGIFSMLGFGVQTGSQISAFICSCCCSCFILMLILLLMK